MSEIVEFVVGSEWNEAFLQNRNYSVIKRTQTIKYEHNFSRRAVEETGEKMRGAMLNPSWLFLLNVPLVAQVAAVVDIKWPKSGCEIKERRNRHHNCSCNPESCVRPRHRRRAASLALGDSRLSSAFTAQHENSKNTRTGPAPGLRPLPSNIQRRKIGNFAPFANVAVANK